MALTGLAFVAAFFAGLAMAVLRHPIWGLYTYVAVFYVHPPSRWWGAFLPDLRWSLLAAAVTLIASLRLPADASKPGWLSTTPARILIAFTVWLWIQSFWAISPEMHREMSVLYTKYILLFYLVYRLIETPQQLRAFLMVHLAGCAYLGVLGYLAPDSGRLEGVGGPGIDEANALAMQLSTGVLIGAMMILAERKWALWVSLAAMPFILNTIVLAGSRGAFLALLVGGLMLWRMKPREHGKLFYTYAALGLVLVGMLAHEAFWERMGTLQATVDESQQMDTSAESRLVLAEAQWRMFKAHPLGTGHRGTEELSPYYIDSLYMSGPVGAQQGGKRSSHNTFLSALVEQGLPGAMLFVMTWLWCIRALARARSAQPSPPPQLAAMVAGVGSALICFLVAGMFVDYLKAEIQFWLFAVLALYPWLAQRQAAAAPAPEGAVAAGRAARQNPAARPATNPTRGMAGSVRDKRR